MPRKLWRSTTRLLLSTGSKTLLLSEKPGHAPGFVVCWLAFLIPGTFTAGLVEMMDAAMVASITALALVAGLPCQSQESFSVQSKSGLRLIVAEQDTDAALCILVPGQSEGDAAIYILFIEHVTVRKPGESEGKHVY